MENIDKKDKEKKKPQNYPCFVNYYKVQNILDEESFEKLLKILDTDLPIVFRVNKLKDFSEEIIKEIDGNLPDIKKIEWFTQGHVYRVDLNKVQLRKNEEFKKYHRFIMKEQQIYNIFRQEEVSMIPVHLMNVQEGDQILDMCASPGSKTRQIIENLDFKSRKAPWKSNSLVVANDIDSKRSFMLAHQTLVLNSMSLLVTNNDAIKFPSCFKFNKVLCDVPCSGDGTIRKNDVIIKNWTPLFAQNLHLTQLKLLLRGLSLLKSGGTLVYSTCSLNPMENEAVVSGALLLLGAKMEVLDAFSELKKTTFEIFGGMETWKVYYKLKNLKYYFSSWEEIPENFRKRRFYPTMFPLKDKSHYKNMIRVYPHSNNSGGFFICLIKKLEDFDYEELLKPIYKMELEAAEDKKLSLLNSKLRKEGKETLSHLPAEGLQIAENEESKVNESNFDPELEKMEKLIKGREDKEILANPKKKAANPEEEDCGEEAKKADVFTTLLPNQILQFNDKFAEFKPFVEFYGVNKDFPLENLFALKAHENIMSRRLVFINEGVKEFLKVTSESKEYNIMHCGVDAFKRSLDDKCVGNYRMLQEGAPLLGESIDKQLIRVDIKQLEYLLNSCPLNFDQISDQDIKNQIDAQSLGPFLINCKNNCNLNIMGRKGLNKLTLLLGAEECLDIKNMLEITKSRI